jgi:hypothetical protein
MLTSLAWSGRIDGAANEFRQGVIGAVGIAKGNAIAENTDFVGQGCVFYVEGYLVEGIAIGLEAITVPTFEYGIRFSLEVYVGSRLGHPIEHDVAEGLSRLVQNQLCW